jgi:tetratricopeptide (TPR) repeat protein
MKSRASTLVGVSVALAAAGCGLVALGAASLGLNAFRIFGFVLLAAGGATATVIRSIRTSRELDAPAMAGVECARALLEQGDHFGAARAASNAVALARTSRTRTAALTTLAWAALGQGYAERAKAALERVDPPHALDLYCYAAVQSANGNTDLAIQALELAGGARDLHLDGAKLLIDLYARQGKMDRAVAAALRSREVLGADNCRLVVKAACEAGAYGPAAILASALLGRTCGPEDTAALVRSLVGDG